MTAQIHDQGYRRYTGERLGVGSAIGGLVTHGVMRVLGIRRPGKNKILPGIVLALAFIPAIVIVGVQVLFSNIRDEGVFEYGDYYGFIGFAVLMFIAFAAPEGLSTDRSSGMLSLYLASPLTRMSYLFSRALSLLLVMLTVTVLPLIMLLIGYTFVGSGPGNAFDWLETLARIVAGGIAISIPLVALGMAMSLVAQRRAYASAAIVVSLLATNIVSSVFFESLKSSNPQNAADYGWLGAFDLFVGPIALAQTILGFDIVAGPQSEMSGWTILGANVFWTVLFAGIAVFSMRRLAVER